jgi:hypothetical protein
MALTLTQRTDLQQDLGITASQAVFTDAQLDRLYERAGSVYELTVCLALDQLLMDAAKLNDYTAGASSEKKSQVFAQLQAMRKVWGLRASAVGAAGMGYGSLSGGVIDLDFMEEAD